MKLNAERIRKWKCEAHSKALLGTLDIHGAKFRCQGVKLRGHIVSEQVNPYTPTQASN